LESCYYVFRRRKSTEGRSWSLFSFSFLTTTGTLLHCLILWLLFCQINWRSLIKGGSRAPFYLYFYIVFNSWGEPLVYASGRGFSLRMLNFLSLSQSSRFCFSAISNNKRYFIPILSKNLRIKNKLIL
jgi:hypothetical protein